MKKIMFLFFLFFWVADSNATEEDFFSFFKIEGENEFNNRGNIIEFKIKNLPILFKNGFFIDKDINKKIYFLEYNKKNFFIGYGMYSIEKEKKNSHLIWEEKKKFYSQKGQWSFFENKKIKFFFNENILFVEKEWDNYSFGINGEINTKNKFFSTQSNFEIGKNFYNKKKYFWINEDTLISLIPKIKIQNFEFYFDYCQIIGSSDSNQISFIPGVNYIWNVGENNFKINIEKKENIDFKIQFGNTNSIAKKNKGYSSNYIEEKNPYNLDTPRKIMGWVEKNVSFVPRRELLLRNPEDTIKKLEGECDDFAFLYKDLLEKEGIPVKIFGQLNERGGHAFAVANLNNGLSVVLDTKEKPIYFATLPEEELVRVFSLIYGEQYDFCSLSIRESSYDKGRFFLEIEKILPKNLNSKEIFIETGILTLFPKDFF